MAGGGDNKGLPENGVSTYHRHGNSKTLPPSEKTHGTILRPPGRAETRQNEYLNT